MKRIGLDRLGLMSPKKAKLYSMDDTIDALKVEAEYGELPKMTVMYLNRASATRNTSRR